MRFPQPLSPPSLRTLALVTVCLGLFLLSQYATTGAKSVRNSTIPYGLATQLRGPVNSITDAEVQICGVPVEIITGFTRIDERVGPLAEAGAWARVLVGVRENGNRYALRIKTIEPQPFLRVRGILEEQNSVDGGIELIVDGITVFDDGTAHRAGHITEGERVDIKAECDLDALRLTATQIVGKASPPGHDKPRLVHFVGVIENDVAPGLGVWQVDGQQVEVNSDTVIDESKGDAVEGAKVKVVAKVVDGSLEAIEIHVLPGKGPKSPE